MQQYQELLQAIKDKGTYKSAARANMPGTTSLFGHQFRHDLSTGFPAITTKKLYWKGVVLELIWFLSGDTNIKFLDEHGCRKMWHEDAYNYYVKIASKNTDESWNAIYLETEHGFRMLTFEEFCNVIKTNSLQQLKQNWSCHDYTLGDCGYQYGKLWRNFGEIDANKQLAGLGTIGFYQKGVDQIVELIDGLKNNPMSRRHIITAWNPATLDDMALNACHALVQWNCRPIPWEIKLELAKKHPNVDIENLAITEAAAGNPNFGPIPQYYLDCQLYQRSADVFLGVPLNIASYSLLTHILAKMCNMIPGDYVHTFGDVHIYDNHKEQVDTLLAREPFELPELKLSDNIDWQNISIDDFVAIAKSVSYSNVASLIGYESHDAITAELSTGLIK